MSRLCSRFVYDLFSACVVYMMILWTPFVYVYLGLTPCRSSIIVCVQVRYNTPFFSQDLADFCRKEKNHESISLFLFSVNVSLIMSKFCMLVESL